MIFHKAPIFIVLILSMVVLQGCTNTILNPPSVSVDDRTVTDYTFRDISDTCSIYNNINISDNSTPCAETEKPFTMYYSEENNWSIMCCEYRNICQETEKTNYSDMCIVDETTKYTGFVFEDNGFLMAQCCDQNGKNCYVDNTVDVSNTTTICDETYQQVLFAPNYESNWTSMCCIGGLQE